MSVTDNRSPPVERQVTIAVTVPRFSDVFSTVLSVPVLLGGQCVGCHGPMGDWQIAATRAQGWAQLVNAAHHRGQAADRAAARFGAGARRDDARGAGVLTNIALKSMTESAALPIRSRRVIAISFEFNTNSAFRRAHFKTLGPKP